MSENEFEIGNSIAWKLSSFAGLFERGLVERYGVGPFIVKQVIEVPTDHVHGVGHKQWVDAETLEGATRFSGKFFQKI